MLRFFRQLRQRLLAENRVSKYMLYAIGDILLVVIGILIALQVNDWNEERTRRKPQFSASLFSNVVKNGYYSDSKPT